MVGQSNSQRGPRAALALTLGLVAAAGAVTPAGAFTQSVGTNKAMILPMGHEWITRMAAAEVLAYPLGTAPDVRDPDDPRQGWRPGAGAAWNTNLSTPGAQAEANRIRDRRTNEGRYASRYKAVFDAIVGERWVDLAGYNIAGLNTKKWWDAAAQEPPEIQYDHFMRRYDDVGGDGGVNSARDSAQRFVEYFVKAATSPPMEILVYDGGASSDPVSVDRAYFLFGRAVHLFEDSFSSEHTVRTDTDNFIRVRQVKSYLCALGSEQHTHKINAILDFSSGDVIWKQTIRSRFDPTWSAYKASNMKPVALTAVEATKDLWAAFIRARGAPADRRADVARAEAQTLVQHWLSYDPDKMAKWYEDPVHRDASYVLAVGQTGPGKSQTDCMKVLDKKNPNQAAFVRTLRTNQLKALYNAIPWAGYEDQFDPQLHIWYAWRWRNAARLSDPPANWTPVNQAADTGARVRIVSVQNGKAMTAPNGIAPDSLIYNREGTPLDFVRVGDLGRSMFRSAANPLLFLDYRAVTGAVKLYAPGVDVPASYQVSPAGAGVSLRNTYWNQYIWLSGDEPYLTRTGNPVNRNAQWRLDPTP